MVDSKVYKDQCAFCFNTPEMKDGLFICVNHKFAYCSRHVKVHNEVDKCKKFVRFIRLRRRLEKKSNDMDIESDSKITKLAIGIEGGCMIEPKFEFCDSWTVIANYPDLSTEKPVEAGDDQLQNIITAESVYHLRELEALAGTWDGSVLVETKHKSLEQLPFVGNIPTKGWRCQFDGGCDKTENLWMNLTDGKIYCGRRNYDGSGGNNHALEHFQETKFPLAVNLGTITPSTADVYSYDEQDMVIDPNLSKHLQHFGINMMQMEKTEKSMIEKEIDLNVALECAIQEDGHKLEPVFGPGFTGIHNLGNSCYMNSLLQSLVQMPEVVKPIVNKSTEIFRLCRQNPYDDLWVQTAKIFSGLLSGEYSLSADAAPLREGFEAPENGVRPYDFRHVVGKTHNEFSTKKQQDVEEYMRYLSEKFRNCLQELQPSAPNVDPLLATNYLAHVVEDNGKTVYFTPDCVYDVDFDVNPIAPVGKDAERPKVHLLRRLREMIERPETVKTGRIVRFATFPRYLLIKVNRHSVTDDWKPVKLDYSLEVDNVLDLEFMRGSLPKPTDNVMIDKTEAAKRTPNRPQTPVNVNAEHLSMLMSMGFTENACRKALIAKSDVNEALDWIMSRLDDPNLNLPAQSSSISGGSGSDEVDAASLNMLMESGFSEAKAKNALRKSKNNVELAFNYLLDSGGSESPVPPGSPAGPGTPPRPTTPPNDQSFLDKLKVNDGKGVYELLGVISHIGSSTRTGHYVYHGLKNSNRWAIFNDEKVAWSESPPVALGYVYVFKRSER